MLTITDKLTVERLLPKITQLWELSAGKIRAIDASCPPGASSPVFTRAGKYTAQGWTEWTQGFQYGAAILQFDATSDEEFLALGRRRTRDLMVGHVTHFGVHDHGFNNISTYGNLLRLLKEGKIPFNEWEKHFYELALKISGAVQAGRWTEIKDGGYIYSFNGPHSLFVDTIRSCRVLMLSHMLDHQLYTENDRKINLLDRALKHIRATADYAVYYGEGRDHYDEWGRTAHEIIFNTNDGNYRCPNSQQGYSGFSTWTRGLAWAMLGFAEELEFVETLGKEELTVFGDKDEIEAFMLKAAKATCDFFIANSPTDGIAYWDTGAPMLYKMGDYLNKRADPFNNYEPVDSSASVIGAQALLRLGHYLQLKGEENEAKKYRQAGLTVLETLLNEPYLRKDPEHHGLILHSIYHRPSGWDYIPKGSKIPYGESTMWGDYHARELVLYIQKILDKQNYYTFFNCVL